MTMTKTFSSKSYFHQKVVMKCNVEKNVVRIFCPKLDVASEFLTALIVGKKVGAVDAVIYSNEPIGEGVVVHLFRGDRLTQFLRSGVKNKVKEEPKSKFTDLVKNAENQS